ncbi:MAG TPA: hypothetical protein VN577_02430 [Terriglobales bacterium]|nr:hypothetical protein [Terriglobales bacterium]
MANYLRVLAESDAKAPLAELRTVLGPEFELIVEDGDEQAWSQLLLRHKDGPEIALIERDPVAPDELGQQELDELVREMENARPLRAVEWLKHFFTHVKTVYVLHPMSGTKVHDGWLAVERVQAYLWKKFGGVLQADNEGFSNREGQHILWQFHGEHEGDLDVAVMNDRGEWVPYTLKMSDAEQVEAFRRGDIPGQ